MAVAVVVALDIDTRVAHPKTMKPLELEPRTRAICEKLFERPMTNAEYKRATLPKGLEGMGIRSPVTLMEILRMVSQTRGHVRMLDGLRRTWHVNAH